MNEVEKLQQLKEQQQVLLAQKQELQLRIFELENALKELEGSVEEEVYEIIGNIMIKRNKEELIKNIKNKKEMYELRIKSIDKQLELIIDQAKKLQDKLSKK